MLKSMSSEVVVGVDDNGCDFDSLAWTLLRRQQPQMTRRTTDTCQRRRNLYEATSQPHPLPILPSGPY